MCLYNGLKLCSSQMQSFAKVTDCKQTAMETVYGLMQRSASGRDSSASQKDLNMYNTFAIHVSDLQKNRVDFKCRFS